MLIPPGAAEAILHEVREAQEAEEQDQDAAAKNERR
jgi:hypothetical protein